MTIATEYQLKAPINLRLDLFVIFATLFIYNFQRLLHFRTEHVDQPYEWENWLSNYYPWILGFTILSGLGSLISWLLLDSLLFPILIPMGIISLFYAWKIFPGASGRIALRELPYTKLWWISLVWVGITVIMPAADAHIPLLSDQVILVSLSRLLLIAGLTIPFDVRDLRADEPKQRTFPQIFGVKKSLRIAVVFLLLHLLLCWFMWQLGFDPLQLLIAISIVTVIMMMIVSKTRTDSHELHFLGAIDGTLILYGLAIILLG